MKKCTFTEDEILRILHDRMRYTMGFDYDDKTTLEWWAAMEEKGMINEQTRNN